MNPIATSDLKAWLECLPDPTGLEQHPLTQRLYDLEFVRRFADQHPEHRTRPIGLIVCLALRESWRATYMQRNFSPRLKRVWNTFFILEAAYFYPAVSSSLFPRSLNELGALLCDKEHLALLAAAGDKALARKIASENPAFWEAIIPYDEVPSPQTISSRREAAIEKLTKELNRQLELAVPVPVSPNATAQAVVEVATTHQEVTQLTLAPLSDHEFMPMVYEPAPVQGPVPDYLPNQSLLLLSYQEQPNPRRPLGTLPLRYLALPHGDEIGPSDLDAIAASLDIAQLMAALGIHRTPDRQRQWREDRSFVAALLERFVTHNDDDLGLQCAACLRHVQLSKIVEIEVGWRPNFMGIKSVSALESIARIALNIRSDDFSRSLAEAILTQAAHVEQLWNLDKYYIPLAHRLTVRLGKMLYYDEARGQIELR